MTPAHAINLPDLSIEMAETPWPYQTASTPSIETGTNTVALTSVEDVATRLHNRVADTAGLGKLSRILKTLEYRKEQDHAR